MTDNIFKSYTENVGVLTPMIADQLKLDEDEFGSETVTKAIREAVMHNARNMKYIDAILRNSTKPLKHDPHAGLTREDIMRYGEWEK